MSTNNETKSLHVIFLCHRSGKSSVRCKNQSIRGLCPFLVLYERKSYIGFKSSVRNLDSTYETQESTIDESKRSTNKSKFSELIDDIDIKGDEYYLKYYRSFHNHELDTNLVENEGKIVDEDIHRKGAMTWLPQGGLAV